jgi:hypothetical protein
MSPSRPQGSTARAWFARLATVLLLPAVSIALVLALFEVALRIAGHRALHEIYSKPTIFWQHDDLLGWRHQPNASGKYVGPRPWPIEFESRVSINSLGLRGPEVPAPMLGEARVLLLGDSMVAAFEVDHEQTFAAVLEQELRDRVGGPVRVINGGVRGYGSDQSYLFFRERTRSLDPDVVVLFHSGNDPADNTTLHEMRRPLGKPAFALTSGGGLELRGSPVPTYPMCSDVRLSARFEVSKVDTLPGRVMCHVQMALLDHSALFSLITISIPWDGSLLGSLYRLGGASSTAGAQRDYASQLTMVILLALADEVTRRGAELIVTGFPSHLVQLDLDRLAERGVEIISLDALESAPAREVRWHHDSHFNPEGHRRLAAVLLPSVEARIRRRVAASGHPDEERDPGLEHVGDQLVKP